MEVDKKFKAILFKGLGVLLVIGLFWGGAWLYVLAGYEKSFSDWESGRIPCDYFQEKEYLFEEAVLTISKENCKDIDSKKAVFFLLNISSRENTSVRWEFEELSVQGGKTHWDSVIPIVPHYIYEINNTRTFSLYVTLDNPAPTLLNIQSSGMVN